MRKSSLLVGVSLFCALFCSTILSNCFGIDDASNVASSGSHQRYMERFLNPELRSKTELHQWAIQYDSLYATMVVSDSLVTKEDARLINIIREFIPNILSNDNHQISEKLFISFQKDVQNRQRLIPILQNAYAEMNSVFQQDLGLQPPEGFIFALVYKDRQQLGDEEIGGFVIRASRFIVIPQAYYFHRGFVLFDSEQFYTIFKHELVHAFVNASAGYKIAIDFPEWFHEMTAISLGGNRKFEIKGETIHRLSLLYQEYYDAAKYLQKKFGRTKYHIFLRESIRKGDPLQRLTEQFGYQSYDQLRWDSMGFAEKLSERIDRVIVTLKNRLNNADFFVVIFVLLMLALPVFLTYWLVQENIDRMKNLSFTFRNANRLNVDGNFVGSLQRYRVFLATIQQTPRLEQYLIRAKNKIRLAHERVNDLQAKILKNITSEILTIQMVDLSTAEKKCFELERIKNTIFKAEFRVQAGNFLADHALNIISKAWKQREKHLENLLIKQQYFEALHYFIDYAIQHHNSDFLPSEPMLSSLKLMLKSIAEANQQPSTFIHTCRQVQQIRKISTSLKRKKSLMIFHSQLGELFRTSKPFCQVKRILKKIKSFRIETNLIGLKELLDVLESNPGNQALEDIAISAIEENVIDDLALFLKKANMERVLPHDVLFYRSILDNFGRLLRILDQGEGIRHEKIKHKILTFFEPKM